MDPQLFRLIRSCNRLYRHLTAVFIPTFALTILLVLFGIQAGQKPSERLLLAFFNVVFFLVTSIFFVAAGFVNKAVKKHYVAWMPASARLCYHKGRRAKLPLTTRWQLLTFLESMSSRKHKIGFTCLHWFALSHFTLMKVSFAKALFYCIY